MHGTASTDSSPQRPRRRWPRRIALVLLASGIIAAGASGLWYYLAERDWHAALAEADQLDPGWRFEDLEAKRTTIPDEQNSARHVLAAHALIPENWPQWPDMPEMSMETLRKDLDQLSPHAPVPARELEAVRVARTAAAAALAKARSLKDLPSGRYPIVTGSNGSRRLGSHRRAADAVADLLAYDVLLRQHDDADGALESCRALANVARSFGDESEALVQLKRMRLRMRACLAIERTQARGKPSAANLAALQTLLEDEEVQPLFLHGARGMRIEMYDSVQAMADGQTPMNGVPAWATPLVLHRFRALAVHVPTIVVEVAKHPVEELAPELRRTMPDGAALPYYFRRNIFPIVEKFVQDLYYGQIRSQALLRCTSAALAVERYRRDNGRLPESLAELVPAYLQRVPSDPFDRQPLRYRKLTDGVVIYSIGHDGADNEGELDRPYLEQRGTDIGVQMWQ